MKRIVFIFFILLPLSAQPGRIELHTVFSPSLGIEKSYNIYLPPGYDSTTEYYPVVYLFRGHEREWANAYEDASRNGKNAKDVADRLIASGIIGNVILVMPGMSSADNVVPSVGVDMANVSLASSKEGLGSGKFEKYLIDDLIPYIDSTYRTIATRMFRGVDGFSLGGQTAIMFALKYNDRFISCGSYDGTLMWHNFDNPFHPGINDDLYLTNAMFDAAFDKPRNIPYALHYNAANILDSLSPAAAGRVAEMTMLFDGGSIGGNNNDVNSAFFSRLTSVIPNTGNKKYEILSPAAEHNWYYADMHLAKTLPLHNNAYQNGTGNITTTIGSPAAGGRYSGTIPVSWTNGFAAVSDTAQTYLFHSSDNGRTWNTLYRSLHGNDTSLSWNTLATTDGTLHRLKLVLASDRRTAVVDTGPFTVDNPGNAPPDVFFSSPAEAAVLESMADVSWYIHDADDDPLQTVLQVSVDNGTTWTMLDPSVSDPEGFQWQTDTVPNSKTVRLKLICSDGVATTIAVSKTFEVRNKRFVYPDDRITHSKGTSNASLSVVTSDAASIVPGQYTFSFTTDEVDGKRYSVSKNGVPVLVGVPVPALPVEGPLFNGMRLLISDITSVIPYTDSLRWEKASTALQVSAGLLSINTDNGPVTAHPFAYNYDIVIADHTIDTSLSMFGVDAIPVPFLVRNTIDGRKTPFIFIDFDGNGTISDLDELYLFERTSGDSLSLGWHLFFSGNSGVKPPAAGDVFHFVTMKPLAEDEYQFNATVESVSGIGSSVATFDLSQNFPNPFNPTTAIAFTLPRRTRVTLVVTDLLGRVIAMPVHNEELEGGKHSIVWDGSGTASGVYFYTLRSEEMVRTHRMVLIK